jgi:hypothetical protein
VPNRLDSCFLYGTIGVAGSTEGSLSLSYFCGLRRRNAHCLWAFYSLRLDYWICASYIISTFYHHSPYTITRTENLSALNRYSIASRSQLSWDVYSMYRNQFHHFILWDSLPDLLSNTLICVCFSLILRMELYCIVINHRLIVDSTNSTNCLKYPTINTHTFN